MEPEIVSRVMDGNRWFWYVYYTSTQQRVEVGVFTTRAEARDAALDDADVIESLTRQSVLRECGLC